MALREQWLPPEIEFETPDPACKFPMVNKPRDSRVNVVLSNSFGFGGVNADLDFQEVGMSQIFVAGFGAVSPAGWNVTALRDALDKNEPLPVQTLARPGWDKPLRARLVPTPAARPEFLAHPRLRRIESDHALHRRRRARSRGRPAREC